MTNENFHTFIDLGKTGIRGTSFNKENKKVQNHIELKIENDLLNNLSNEEKSLENLIFNLEKKNGEYLNEISLMVDNSNILSISITIFKKSDEQILNNNFIKYITGLTEVITERYGMQLIMIKVVEKIIVVNFVLSLSGFS